jgi:RES domain-containing protein
VWRLCQTAHQSTAFRGDGARRYGGRWNRKGQAAVYTAATQSLAALEVLVHVDTDLVVNDSVVFAVDIPDDVAIERMLLTELPPDWREEYPPLACQTLGGVWLEQGRSVVLAVPSAIIPAETNYLLNPEHSDFDRLIIQPPTPFKFDPRLLC